MQGSTYNAMQLLAKFSMRQEKFTHLATPPNSACCVADGTEVVSESNLTSKSGMIERVYVINTYDDKPAASKKVVEAY